MSARARALAAAATAVVTLGATIWLAALDTPEYSGARLVLVLFAGCALAAGGLVVVLNGERLLGVLTTLAGLSWLAERLLQAIPTSVTFTLGYLLTGLWAGFLVHALMAFPSGRLGTMAERVTVAVGYLLDSVGNLPEFVFIPWSVATPGSPDFLLSISEDGDLALTMSRIFDGLTLAWFLFALVLFGRRVRLASPPERRAFAAVWLAGIAFFGMGSTIVAAGLGWLPEDEAYGVWIEVLACTVPIVLATTLVLARLAQDRLVTLVVDLERRDPALDLRQALRRALGDPSLDVVYWRDEPDGWIDDRGRSVALPSDDPTRAVTPIERGDGRFGALVHDPILLRSPDRMQTATAAAGLALDNERLNAELRARVDDLRESRVRIVEAGDRERRRVERNLHDGAQQRLMGVAMVIRLAETRARGSDGDQDGLLGEAVAEVEEAIRELRELARGLHPAILTDVGLQGALEALAERSAVPVELSVDVRGPVPDQAGIGAYYVVAEALANVAKHAGAGRATVRLAQDGERLHVEVSDDGRGGAHAAPGSGLQGLADRVDALGGRMRVESPPGDGTRVAVELPCA